MFVRRERLCIMLRRFFGNQYDFFLRWTVKIPDRTNNVNACARNSFTKPLSDRQTARPRRYGRRF